MHAHAQNALPSDVLRALASQVQLLDKPMTPFEMKLAALSLSMAAQELVIDSAQLLKDGHLPQAYESLERASMCLHLSTEYQMVTVIA